jgi:hypothetical protein
VDTQIREAVGQLGKRIVSPTGGLSITTWHVNIYVRSDRNPWPFTAKEAPGIINPSSLELADRARKRNHKPKNGAPPRSVLVNAYTAAWGYFQFFAKTS